jgi:hypothetical protein
MARWWWGVAGVLLLCSGAAAVADEGPQRPDPMAPSELLHGPSLQETGRIGGFGAESLGGGIAPAGAGMTSDRGEKSIEPAAQKVRSRPLEPVGTINPVTLEREIGDRFGALDDCRIEVARQERVPPGNVRADALTLRWKILPTGAVAATQVVATTATDPAVMDCVKVVMATWTFTHPNGGSVSLERPFKFR